MTDQTDKFFDVTQAAEKMYEALRDLRQETEEYSVAGGHLEAAASKTEALTDATLRLLAEQGQRWEGLKRILVDEMKPSLNNLDAQATRQTAHLSSLSVALAGQQNQLTQLQQSSVEALKAISESRQVLDKLVAASDQRKKMLEKHSQQLSELRGELGQQRDAMSTLHAGIGRGVAAAVVASLLSLGTLVAVLLT